MGGSGWGHPIPQRGQSEDPPQDRGPAVGSPRAGKAQSVRVPGPGDGAAAGGGGCSGGEEGPGRGAEPAGDAVGQLLPAPGTGPPWGSTGGQAGGPRPSPPRRPCPPRLLRIPQRLSLPGPPPARGAPPAGQGGGRAPRGGVGMEGGPPSATCAGCPPARPLGRPRPAPGDAGGPGRCPELPVLSCPPDVAPLGGIHRAGPFPAAPARARQRRRLAGGEGAPAGEEALPPPGLGPAGSGHRGAGGRHRPPLPLGKASLGRPRGD